MRPTATVIGGALDSRGTDDPAGARQAHSPTTFIRDLGAAYRASGRTTPIMDVFDQHVYADNSSLPPSMPHTAGNDDRRRRLHEARVAARRGLRRDGAARVDSADRLRRVRGGDRDSERQGSRVLRRRAADVGSGRREHAGALLRRGVQARSLPAERDRDPRLPRRRRERTRSVAVRAVLRRRDAEVVLRRDSPGSGRSAKRHAHELSRPQRTVDHDLRACIRRHRDRHSVGRRRRRPGRAQGERRRRRREVHRALHLRVEAVS